MNTAPAPSLLILEDRHKAAFAFGGMAQALGALLFGWGLGGGIEMATDIPVSSAVFYWGSVVVALLMLLVTLKQTTLVFPKGRTVTIDKKHRPLPWLSWMFVLSGLSNLGSGLANDLAWSSQIGIGSLLVALGAFLRSRYVNAAPTDSDDPLPETH